MLKKMKHQERRTTKTDRESSLKGLLVTIKSKDRLQVELKTISKMSTIVKRSRFNNNSNLLKAPEGAETCRKTKKTLTTSQIKIWE
jgi:hypothetical protein